MQNLIFWRSWSPAQRALYFFIFALLIFLGTVILILELAGIGSLIGWDTFAQGETVQLQLENFQRGPFDFTIDAPATIFWQFFSGGESFIPVWAYYAFLAITALCFVTLTTVITHLRSIWYFIGASLIVGALVSLKLDLLFLFDTESKEGLIIALLLYIPATYVFAKFKQEVPFMTRWVVFAGITLTFGLIIHFFSGIANPFFQLSTSSFYLMMVLSLIFTLMIAHEIMIAIITLLTSNSDATGGNSLWHFLIFSAIYLGTLIMAYLTESNLVRVNLIYINLFVLLITSAFLGIWGFKKREEQYDYLTSFKPAGAFFYLSMMLAALSTLALLMVTTNDPGKEVFRDFIVNGHLAFGIIFLLYVMANFIGPLGKNMPVHRILFNPSSMPYFTFRLVGIITFLAFLLPAGRSVSVFQTRSAFYNTLGDMYLSVNQPLFALRYYQDGASYGYNNHKSNYSLGKFHSNQGAYARAIPFYKNAISKWPTPQSYIDLANAYIQTNRKYDAIFILKQGVETFPENYELLNNLGLAFNELNIIDSAYIFMSKAHETDHKKLSSSSNMMGLLIKNEITVNADSLLEAFADPEEPISRNNAFVLKNRQRESWNIPLSDYDSALSFLQSSVIFNESINQLFSSDTLDRNWLHTYTRYGMNSRYSETLEFGEALNLKHEHQLNQAMRLINAVANRSEEVDYYVIGGKWALQENAPDVAAQYFKWSTDRSIFTSKLPLAVAYSENHQKLEAAALWQQLSADESPEIQKVADQMLGIYAQDPTSVKSADDETKYLYLRYMADPRDTSLIKDIAGSIRQPDLKAMSYLDASERLFDLDKTTAAVNIFAYTSGLEISDSNLYDRIVWHDLKLLAATRNLSGLAQRINEGVNFDQSHFLEKQYYTALIKASANDTTAMPLFEWVAASNPFEEEPTVTAANYISQKDRFKAYDYLISALEINPNSIRLLKAYILQCAETQLDTYAALSLEELKKLIPSNEYEDFLERYLQRVTMVEERERNF